MLPSRRTGATILPPSFPSASQRNLRNGSDESSDDGSDDVDFRARKFQVNEDDDDDDDIPSKSPSDNTPPPTDRPLFRQSLAFGSSTSSAFNVDPSKIYEAKVAHRTAAKNFLPGQMPARATIPKKTDDHSPAKTPKTPKARKSRVSSKSSQPDGCHKFRLNVDNEDLVPITGPTPPAPPSKQPAMMVGGGPYSSAFRVDPRSQWDVVSNTGQGTASVNTGVSQPPSSTVQNMSPISQSTSLAAQDTMSSNAPSCSHDAMHTAQPLVTTLKFPPAPTTSTPTLYYRRDYDAERASAPVQKAPQLNPPPSFTPANALVTAPLPAAATPSPASFSTPSIPQSNTPDSTAHGPSPPPSFPESFSELTDILSPQPISNEPSARGIAPPRLIRPPPLSPVVTLSPTQSGLGEHTSNTTSSSCSGSGLPSSSKCVGSTVDAAVRQDTPATTQVSLFINDTRTQEQQFVDLQLHVEHITDGPNAKFRVNAQEMCEQLQNSPGRIYGPVRLYIMRRNVYKQYILRVGDDQRDIFTNTQLELNADLCLEVFVEAHMTRTPVLRREPNPPMDNMDIDYDPPHYSSRTHRAERHRETSTYYQRSQHSPSPDIQAHSPVLKNRTPETPPRGRKRPRETSTCDYDCYSDDMGDALTSNSYARPSTMPLAGRSRNPGPSSLPHDATGMTPDYGTQRHPHQSKRRREISPPLSSVDDYDMDDVAYPRTDASAKRVRRIAFTSRDHAGPSRPYSPWYQSQDGALPSRMSRTPSDMAPASGDSHEYARRSDMVPSRASKGAPSPMAEQPSRRSEREHARVPLSTLPQHRPGFDRGYESPTDSDDEDQLDQKIVAATESCLQTLNKTWTKWWKLASKERVRDRISRYKLFNEFRHEFVGQLAPFRHSQCEIEERHIISALKIQEPNFGYLCTETLRLFRYYGLEGKREENHRVMDMYEDIEDPPFGAGTRLARRFLRVLQEVDGEWNLARQSRDAESGEQHASRR